MSSVSLRAVSRALRESVQAFPGEAVLKKLMLTHEDLLHGAVYALEQAGKHLHCAVKLWNEGDYAHGLMIAVFAREEVGRFKLLRQEREEAMKTGPRSGEDISKVLEHKAKLKAGANGVFMEFDPNDPELAGLRAPHLSPEWKRARAIADARMLKKYEEQPSTTHRVRMRAQYVDLLEDGTWSRPCLVDAELSGKLVMEIANDYAHPMGHLFQAGVGAPWDELTLAIRAWPNAPSLLPPVWPDLEGFWARREAEKKAPTSPATSA
jgi:AbiV family abortive infection protein